MEADEGRERVRKGGRGGGGNEGLTDRGRRGQFDVAYASGDTSVKLTPPVSSALLSSSSP